MVYELDFNKTAVKPKTVRSYHFTPIKMNKIKKIEIPRLARMWSIAVGQRVNRTAPLAVLNKVKHASTL